MGNFIFLLRSVFLVLLVGISSFATFAVHSRGWAKDPEPPHDHHSLMDSEFAWLLANPTPELPPNDLSQNAGPTGSGILSDTFAIHLPVVQIGGNDDERGGDEPTPQPTQQPTDDPTSEPPQSLTDSDADGLTDEVEAALGTNPNTNDSDCDYRSDLAEVVDAAAPLDGDNDGLIDALENSLIDSNRNGGPDDADSSIGSLDSLLSAVGLQINCCLLYTSPSPRDS